MKKLILPIIILFLLLTVRLPAQVSPVSNLNQQNTSVMNNNLNFLQNGLYAISGILSQYFTNGILNPASGGTGSNLSQEASGDTLLITQNGVVGVVTPGTAGYYYKSNGPNMAPSYSAISQSKVIFINRADIETSVAATSTVSTTIDASGDWNGKQFIFVGETSGNGATQNALGTGTCTGLTDTGATSFTGSFGGANTTGSGVCNVLTSTSWGVFSGLTWGQYTATPNGSGNCSISISGGNLIETAVQVHDTSYTNQKTSCEITGMIVRVP